jgi:superfamily II DNA helicase RecQ
MGKSKDIERDYAKILYINQFLTHKEIATRIKVAEKTITKWAKEDNWRKERQSVSITRETQLRNLYEQIDELNAKIKKRPEGERYSDSKESDILSKLTSSAKKLENEASVSDVIEVSKRVLNWLVKRTPEKAKEVAGIFDDYIKEQLKK